MFTTVRVACLTLMLSAAMTGCMHKRMVVQNSGQTDGLSVSGTGEASAAPDIAKISLGVEARAAASETATAEVSAKMQAVIAALKQAGVADADIQTSQLSIYFERNPGPIPMPEQPARGEAAGGEAAAPKAAAEGHYVASNMVQVKLRNLDAAETVIGIATGAGVNQMYGIQFELEHPETLQAQARKLAVTQAKQNAKELAELMGVTLGPLVAIRENGGQAVLRGNMMARAEMAKSSMPVERGEVTTQHTVELVYELP